MLRIQLHERDRRIYIKFGDSCEEGTADNIT